MEYLTKTYPTGLRWAIAGRNEGKLQDLRTKLKVSDSVGVVVVDSSGTLEYLSINHHCHRTDIVPSAHVKNELDAHIDQKSLDAVASRTKVIISTAGPYALIGINKSAL